MAKQMYILIFLFASPLAFSSQTERLFSAIYETLQQKFQYLEQLDDCQITNSNVLNQGRAVFLDLECQLTGSRTGGKQGSTSFNCKLTAEKGLTSTNSFTVTLHQCTPQELRL